MVEAASSNLTLSTTTKNIQLDVSINLTVDTHSEIELNIADGIRGVR